MLVVALSPTAVSTGVSACGFGAADTWSADCPAAWALRHNGSLTAEHRGGHRIRVFFSRQPGEEKETLEQTCTNAAMIVTMVTATNVPARMLREVERI